ncbi:hypothetical protein NP233_g1996 [Leucocoprinus birnbaumii]|uniref:Uncharacterized protein n=1 Tax=Leucocoprinus birnbaumii TaxID=56174 RepID=A0AAD5W249_9AGAR|nr:hypothetical protein NP233_g1996 [Leucocoprinus birnbaumii]
MKLSQLDDFYPWSPSKHLSLVFYIMVYDAVTIRRRLLRSNGYIARPGWLSSVGWHPSGNSHCLIHAQAHDSEASTPAPAYLTIVGNVDRDRLYVGTSGSFNPSFGTKFESSKFQIKLNCPEDDPTLREDWITSIEMLKHAQAAIADTPDRRYLIGPETPTPSIKLSAPIFDKVDPGNPGEIDLFVSYPNAYDIRTWPVSTLHRHELEALFETHTVLPLAAYDMEEKLVAPERVQSVLAGALVEMTFSLRRYLMGKGPSRFDCFSGRIEQVVVLRPPGPPLPSPFRDFRRNAGPWRPGVDSNPVTPSTGSRQFSFTPCVPPTQSPSAVDAAGMAIVSRNAALAVSSPVPTPPSTPHRSGAIDNHPYTNLTPLLRMVDPEVAAAVLREVAGLPAITGGSGMSPVASGSRLTAIAGETDLAVTDGSSSMGTVAKFGAEASTSANAYPIKRKQDDDSEDVATSDARDEDAGGARETNTAGSKVESATAESSSLEEPGLEESPKKKARTAKGKGKAL